MASSLESFTKVVVNDLEVVDTYKELMTASTEQGSAYIKAKETLESLLEDSNFSNTDKAAVVAQTISAIATGITGQAMNAAIKIAESERDAPYLLAKLKEDTILVQENQNKVATDVAKDDEEIKNKIFQGWKIQGELVRDFGVNAYDLALTDDIIPVARYANDGVKYEATRQAKANVYNTYASSYRGNGYVAIVTDSAGYLTNTTTGDANGLTDAQTKVAIRQEQGFDDNMRQHVANSSASFMSMLLSTEASGIDYTAYLAHWTTSIDYLNETV